MEKKSALFWHIRSFQDYIKEKINPFGLRVQIFPTLEDMNPEFKTKWKAVLQACSSSLMELFIAEYNQRSVALDVEIISTCKKLQVFKTHKSIPDKEIKLKTHLETFNKDI